MSKVVAIDGPAGAGKSTIAQMLAQECGLTYVNTGSQFRAIAWLASREGISLENISQAFLDTVKLEYIDGELYINGSAPGEELRTSACAAGASLIATQERVRAFLLPVQRAAAEKNWIVMEGRDIGSVVFPDAAYKFFVTASVEERARRRLAQNPEEGKSFDEIKAAIAARDEQDSNRSVAPLRLAEDAVLIDTSDLSIDQVIGKIKQYMDENPREK